MPAHSLDTRMAHLEGAYEQVNYRLTSMDARLNSMDARLNSMDAHLLDLRKAIDALGLNVDRRFMWLVGLLASTWLTTIAAILPIYFRR